ncbi:cytidine deaminase, partial [Dysosmobacter welbionis]
GQIRQTAAGGLLAQIHAQAVLSVILEQGVGPSGTMAFLVGAIGRGGSRTAPDGGAAGGVGDVHPVTEQLGNQAGIAGLGAAGAGAGELQHGLTELAALDGVVLHVLLLGHLGDAVVEDLLLGGLLLLVHHG